MGACLRVGESCTRSCFFNSSNRLKRVVSDFSAYDKILKITGGGLLPLATGIAQTTGASEQTISQLEAGTAAIKMGRQVNSLFLVWRGALPRMFKNAHTVVRTVKELCEKETLDEKVDLKDDEKAREAQSQQKDGKSTDLFVKGGEKETLDEKVDLKDDEKAREAQSQQKDGESTDLFVEEGKKETLDEKVDLKDGESTDLFVEEGKKETLDEKVDLKDGESKDLFVKERGKEGSSGLEKGLVHEIVDRVEMAMPEYETSSTDTCEKVCLVCKSFFGFLANALFIVIFGAFSPVAFVQRNFRLDVAEGSPVQTMSEVLPVLMTVYDGLSLAEDLCSLARQIRIYHLEKKQQRIVRISEESIKDIGAKKPFSRIATEHVLGIVSTSLDITQSSLVFASVPVSPLYCSIPMTLASGVLSFIKVAMVV